MTDATRIDFTTLELGERVAIHPASDWFMRGERYGRVEVIGRKWIHVRLDRSNRRVRFSPSLLEPLS
jgi:hypothetical protein